MSVPVMFYYIQSLELQHKVTESPHSKTRNLEVLFSQDESIALDLYRAEDADGIKRKRL